LSHTSPASKIFRLALASYRAAVECCPGGAITLRQGGYIIEDNQRSRLRILIS
jgi:hypothetical protein